MLKRDELSNPQSCLNKARDDERIFVLLARDPAAPVAIRMWCDARILIGKNKPDDPQILEAIDCAEKMRSQGTKSEREIQLEDLLMSARAIAQRQGEDTAWDIFDQRIASFGIGSITPRVFKVPERDKTNG